MRPEDISDSWLKDANERYRSAGVHPKTRGFKALQDLSKERNCAIIFPSAAADRIFDWFKANTKSDSHQIGALFTGVYFYDTCFWPVQIPIGFGRFELNALKGLEGMPESMKEDLRGDTTELWSYVLYWADCADYAFGLDSLMKSQKLCEKARGFLRNGNDELKGVVAQLTTHRPNPKAALSARMACEIFLKVALIQEEGLDDKGLKRIGHDIKKVAKRVQSHIPAKELGLVVSDASVFPEVSDRYDGVQNTLEQVWKALSLAQISATLIVRHYSGRDIRPQLINKA